MNECLTFGFGIPTIIGRNFMFVYVYLFLEIFVSEYIREELQNIGGLLQENGLMPEKKLITDALFQINRYEQLLVRCVNRFEAMDLSDQEDIQEICELKHDIVKTVNYKKPPPKKNTMYHFKSRK